MNKSVQRLPSYLQKYCMEQDYDRYTPRDHAAWRYIMHQSKNFFKQHAVSTYLPGLEATGISCERIPRINEIDEALRRFGWGAVGVSGFIPPAAFLDCQARGIMPIAMDMRTLEHLAYTPAPDIVHEAAGHVPLLIDEEYRTYLSSYANVAKKALISRDDIALYEAIRLLSDIKENPDATASQKIAAEKNLEAASNKISEISELAKIARMNWWTAEYGLAGDLKNPKIFGAGLLSSVGESRHCLQDHVKKIRLSTKCIEFSYNITEPQPQLFVAEDLAQLKSVLYEIENGFAFKVGGKSSLEQAKRCATVNTVVLDSGLQISGILDSIEYDESDPAKILFLKFSSPVQLAESDHELPGHSKQKHMHGFSSPIGPWLDRNNSVVEKLPQHLTDLELSQVGLHQGKHSTLNFASGFRLEGELSKVHRIDGTINYLSFRNAKLTRGSSVYFDPSWGDFDLAVGTAVISVFGGPADREAYGEYELGTVSSSPGRSSPFTQHEIENFSHYKFLRAFREGKEQDLKRLEALFKTLSLASFKTKDWLLSLESVELIISKHIETPYLDTLKSKLLDPKNYDQDSGLELSSNGLNLIASHNASTNTSAKPRAS